MPVIALQIAKELDRLCLQTSSDFASLSLVGFYGQRFQWEYAYGNRNDRYRRMVVKPGAGPDGLSLRTGKPVIWSEQADPNGKISNECPLLAAEQLRSAAVVPLLQGNAVIGLLLTARRSLEQYTNQDVTLIVDHLPNIALLLNNTI